MAMAVFSEGLLTWPPGSHWDQSAQAEMNLLILRSSYSSLIVFAVRIHIPEQGAFRFSKNVFLICLAKPLVCLLTHTLPESPVFQTWRGLTEERMMSLSSPAGEEVNLCSMVNKIRPALPYTQSYMHFVLCMHVQDIKGKKTILVCSVSDIEL